MVIFYFARGTCALATHLALEHSGAPYEARRLDFQAEEQRAPAYLQVNPKGRVPALVTPQGVLTETPALLQYIAQAHPASGLAPLEDPFALARMNEFNSYLCATVHVNHAHKGRGYRWVDASDTAAIEAMRKQVPRTMTQSFALIEQGMLQGPWVLGERFSTSDYYLFTLAGWLAGDGVDIAQFPRVAQHTERLRSLAVVQKVLAHHQA